MAIGAVARANLVALRREIAKIEGTLAERLATPDDAVILRRNGGGVASIMRTGVDKLDAALGGGLPAAGLTELRGGETRDAGAVAGFTLALLALHIKALSCAKPLLWIGTSEIFREAGQPYALGLDRRFGIEPDRLIVAQVERTADALWLAEEAACQTGLSAVILELRGNPQRLDLTATRRLHLRAQKAGHPLLLLRQAACSEPTTAPIRLAVEAASAAPRHSMAGPLAGSIGPPAFNVAIDKNRLSPPARFILEWNADEHVFRERIAAHPVTLVPASRHRTPAASALGTVVALGLDRADAAAGGEPAGEQRPSRRRARRAG